MPVVTGSITGPRQTLVAVPGSVSFFLISLEPAVISPPVFYGSILINLVHPSGEYNYVRRALYGDGLIFLGLPTSTTITKKVVALWDVRSPTWRVEY